MPKTDGARVVADLRRLAEFGRYKTGVHRPTYSPEDAASRQWLADKFAEAGLDPVIDGIGNVFGRNKRASRVLLVGSHSETQPHGGWLDGALGVIYGLEAARALAADPSLDGVGVEAVAWADEEGHYGNMLGSRSFTGALSDDEIAQATSRDGKEADRRAGRGRLCRAAANRMRPAALYRLFRGAYRAGRHARGDRPAHRHRRGDHRQLELLGHRHRRAEPCRHDRNASPQGRRRRTGAARRAHPRPLRRNSPGTDNSRTVWTIGRILIDPNAPSIVPGRAEMQVQFRDTDTGILARFEQALHELVADADRAGPCAVAIAPISKSEPAHMDAGFQRAIEKAAERHAPGLHMRMPSGAGHDAQILARHMRSAMLFVPSINGVSHHWSENTSDEDIMLGAQVFADAAAAMLKAG